MVSFASMKRIGMRLGFLAVDASTGVPCSSTPTLVTLPFRAATSASARSCSSGCRRSPFFEVSTSWRDCTFSPARRCSNLAARSPASSGFWRLNSATAEVERGMRASAAGVMTKASRQAASSLRTLIRSSARAVQRATAVLAFHRLSADGFCAKRALLKVSMLSRSDSQLLAALG